MIEPIDYVQTSDKSIHIVNYSDGEQILATEIYRLIPDPARHMFGTSVKYQPRSGLFFEKYVQRDKDNRRVLTKKDIVRVFSARKSYLGCRDSLRGVWKKMDRFFHNLGISEIGIYGSLMVDMEPHNDVDFVIYGVKNWRRLKKNIHELHRTCQTRPITQQTIDDRVETGRKFFHSANSFEKIFPRQWSTLEIDESVHATVHFVKNRDRIFDVFRDKFPVQRLSGNVRGATGFDFWPKTCRLDTKFGVFTVFSSMWPYQSAFVENERVVVCGGLDRKARVIYLTDRKAHYIRI